ncbi:hypothetical protein I79_008552 [Cricetulus griseus]|uniref:Uncharacterized protein n=1 Tax=Cricetulus griseus TaxID=10029 RepID=G3HDE9_CRIGR|nr:hypothetical protein I79_008552 [Cricetulus griseus]
MRGQETQITGYMPGKEGNGVLGCGVWAWVACFQEDKKGNMLSVALGGWGHPKQGSVLSFSAQEHFPEKLILKAQS